MNDVTDERREAGRLAASLTPRLQAAMVSAAEQALLPRYRKLSDDQWAEKSPGEVVTIADRECEAMLGEALAAILPEASIVGEEAVDAEPELTAKLSDELCWIVDPLDGTGYFAAGEGPFGIMVALANRGRPVGGWILDPLSGRFFWAASGEGAWIDGRRVTAGETAEISPVFGLSPLLRRRPERHDAITARLAGHFTTCDIPRCAAAHYPTIVLGSPALTYFERTLPWDHAPGVLLLEEAGGRAARLDGTDYRVDDDRVGLLAATSLLRWEQAAALLQNLPD